jgi:hypothetical protein
VREYETFQGVIQATKDIFLEAVDHEYLLEIEDDILGFLNQTPTDMLTHLRNRGGALDFADTKTLLAERDGEWDASEVPQLYFNWVEKAIQGLTCAGINSDLNERCDMALYYLKASGEFDAAVREWENRPAQIWTSHCLALAPCSMTGTPQCRRRQRQQCTIPISIRLQLGGCVNFIGIHLHPIVNVGQREVPTSKSSVVALPFSPFSVILCIADVNFI